MEPLTVIPGFGVFPQEYTCDGADRSPSITVFGARAPCLAFIMEDLDAPGGIFTHWILWNVPAAERIPGGLPAEGTLSEPAGAVQGTNDFGTVGYRGPCLFRGGSHRFLFRVCGLSRPLDLPPGADRVDLGRAMGDAIREYGEAVAAYGRAAEVAPSRC
ncbi:putative kinase inhibitor [Methanoculleus chikugoensis]|jgi:Raf kinase inhibitor-like YbhB/YbcL family protein|uniref:Putative kinase inhibitor n=1 Tax=Methanoculleus chikugoensis TaxID=118126 RepID=A0A1M4MKG8_9EURY|nr:YbhB/YbcL family Raf kinase inhibitor-like protein [Methanoculleus chikugoensis]SCL75415.1 putative kinase inhibitor [Methanoculleus chikugoensis]